MKAVKRTSKFEPADQMQKAFAELTDAMIKARAAIDRVEWLKDRLLEKVNAAQEAADSFDVYTEEQAAEMFGITTRTLIMARREKNLPHINFGKTIRYTKEHLYEIAAAFEIGEKTRAAGLKIAA